MLVKISLSIDQEITLSALKISKLNVNNTQLIFPKKY